MVPVRVHRIDRHDRRRACNPAGWTIRSRLASRAARSRRIRRLAGHIGFSGQNHEHAIERRRVDRNSSNGARRISPLQMENLQRLCAGLNHLHHKCRGPQGQRLSRSVGVIGVAGLNPARGTKSSGMRSIYLKSLKMNF